MAKPRRSRNAHPTVAVLGDRWPPIERMLRRLSPDLARYIKDFAYGEVYARPGLGLKEREIISLTCLTMLNLKPQLRTHLQGALNVGWTRDEIREMFIHMALYAGFPAALSGLQSAQELFDEMDRKGT